VAYTDDATLLQNVRDAITAIVTGGVQSYTIGLPGGGSRTVTKIHLAELRKMEADLVARINQASRGRFGVAVFRGTGGRD